MLSSTRAGNNHLAQSGGDTHSIEPRGRKKHTCSSALLWMSAGCRRQRRSARFASTPSPEQGASSRTRSKGTWCCPDCSRRSADPTVRKPAGNPCCAAVPGSPRSRRALASLATSCPCARSSPSHTLSTQQILSGKRDDGEGAPLTQFTYPIAIFLLLSPPLFSLFTSHVAKSKGAAKHLAQHPGGRE